MALVLAASPRPPCHPERMRRWAVGWRTPRTGRRRQRRVRLEEGLRHHNQHPRRRTRTRSPINRCSRSSPTSRINVNADLVPEADYFTKLNTELAGGTGKHDAFMLGAYFPLPAAGPAGWIEDFHPWPQNSSATGLTTTSLEGHLRRTVYTPPDGISRPATPGQRAGNGRSHGASRTTSSPTTRSISTSAGSRSCPTGSTISSSWQSILPTARRTGTASPPAVRSPGPPSIPAS